MPHIVAFGVAGAAVKPAITVLTGVDPISGEFLRGDSTPPLCRQAGDGELYLKVPVYAPGVYEVIEVAGTAEDAQPQAHYEAIVPAFEDTHDQLEAYRARQRFQKHFVQDNPSASFTAAPMSEACTPADERSPTGLLGLVIGADTARALLRARRGFNDLRVWFPQATHGAPVLCWVSSPTATS